MEIIKFEKGMIPEAGKCYSDVPNEDYHHIFIEWLSSSDLKNHLRSEEFFWMRQDEKKNQTEKEIKLAFETGTAFHDALESLIVWGDLSLFEQNTLSFSGKSLTKKARELKALNPDKNIITEESYDNIPIMAKKAKAEADELNVFHGGYVELTFFWIDKEAGIKLKCKTDYIRFDPNFITDFKTSKDCREKELSKDIANLNYHLSAAMYMEGVESVIKEPVEEFCYIAVNKTAPFEVEHYFLDPLALTEGHFLFRKILNSLSDRKQKKPEFKKIGIPFWALTHLDKGL